MIQQRKEKVKLENYRISSPGLHIAVLKCMQQQSFLFYVKVYVGGKARITTYRRLQLSGEIPIAKAEELSWENARFIGPYLILFSLQSNFKDRSCFCLHRKQCCVSLFWGSAFFFFYISFYVLFSEKKLELYPLILKLLSFMNISNNKRRLFMVINHN